ncbi:amino acid ABC transporter membrane protein (PAAT family) [Leucobacter komagatae]|uniref:Amino acid ABC transporter membrane protein (PAAT family) n=1 Tax=Leucobacter komagatae TaxID=55969 RepID=A0A542Y9N8_9MICO|nr:amino acid ABC transporter permease [Leucobacter komagatae]TQL44802.1 amino acid ABC transporter membrane protein (PAAT family) [Leucobacter komagatae]
MKTTSPPHAPASAGAARDITPLEIVPLKRYGRMVIAAIAALLVGGLVFALVTSKNLDWSVVGQYLFAPVIIEGVILTVQLTVLAVIIGIVLGIVLALMKLSDNKVLTVLADLYLWFFRGTPQLIQLIFWFNLAFLFPTISLGFVSWDTNALITPFIAALIGLSLNEGAYMAEIIRGGILGVPKGQREAAVALGFTPLEMMTKIILPQTMRMVIPPTGNQAIAMLKVTSLVSVISARDLLTNAQMIYSRNYYVIELLIVACAWYLLLTTVATLLQNQLEKKYAGRSGNTAGRGNNRGLFKRLTQMGAQR